jgi:hypothetical protein
MTEKYRDVLRSEFFDEDNTVVPRVDVFMAWVWECFQVKASIMQLRKLIAVLMLQFSLLMKIATIDFLHSYKEFT